MSETKQDQVTPSVTQPVSEKNELTVYESDDEGDGDFGEESKRQGQDDDAGSDDDGEDGEKVEDDELDALKREAGNNGDEGDEQFGRGKRRRKDDEQAIQGSSNTSIKQTEEIASAAWSSFQSTSSEPQPASSSQETITITDTYKFANETLTKQRIVPIDHPDAVAWLKKQAIQQPAPATASATLPPQQPRKKKRTSKLASLASSSAAQQPKKMNTLEKSKSDWEGWKGGAGGTPATTTGQALTEREREEMEAQTRNEGAGTAGGGGYLGRRDFLERVRDRTGGA